MATYARPSLPLQPTTPRTPKGSRVNNSTPRSSRRQTLGTPGPSRLFLQSFDPLPPLPLKPFPTGSFAKDDGLLQKLESDKAEIQDAINLMRARAGERQRGFNEYVTEMEVEMKGIEASMRELEGLAVGWSESSKREREEAEGMREREREVEARKRALKASIESIKGDVMEVEAKLRARRELKDAQRSAFHQQSSQNGPELAFFESKLGLKIRSLGRDRILFKFTNIDPASYNRIFSFEVDVSKPSYSVSQSTPINFLPRETLDQLVERLNANRDLYGFFIGIRKALRDEVGREKERSGVRN